MSHNPPGQYLISLCMSMQQSNESFGIATRIGSSNSKFQFEATKVIHSILAFSPAPDAMAVQFLIELEKVKGMSSLVKPVLNCVSEFDCLAWSTRVINYLRDNFSQNERFQELEPVTKLATEMLSHLLIAARNLGWKNTPQETSHSTPNIDCLREIKDLLEDAILPAKRSQSALKELLFRRDGYLCPLTGFPFSSPVRHVNAEAAHILRLSFNDKPLTLKALESFAGRQLAEEVKQNINHPYNAFNVETNAHYTYNTLAWGIEAKKVNDQWKYFFREVRLGYISATIKLREGDEIVFGRGEGGQFIDKPNPMYCNLKLALARALDACGAADVIAEVYADDDDDEAIITQCPVYFGGPFVSDDALLRRLEDRLFESLSSSSSAAPSRLV